MTPSAETKSVAEYLREIDAGTDNACWVGCAKGDPGAVLFTSGGPLNQPALIRDLVAALELCRDALDGGHLPGNVRSGDEAYDRALEAIAAAKAALAQEPRDG